MKRLSRSEKEQLLVRKMTELQTRWGNPLDADWELNKLTDERLDEVLADTIRQLRFEQGIVRHQQDEKTFRIHVQDGQRKGVFWETVIPVSDPMERQARERGRSLRLQPD